MRKITLLLLLAFVFASCKINQDSDLMFVDDEISQFGSPCNFQGRVYHVTSYLYEIPVNFNGDDIYSNNLILESSCYTQSIDFNQEDKVFSIIGRSPLATVEIDTNGNPIQIVNCSIGDGFRLSCAKDGNTINLISNTGNLIHSGTLSNDNTVITFVVPNELLFSSNSNQILNEDGTITNYDGVATIQFELE